MKEIKGYIENYGFEIEYIEDHIIKGYYCFNHQSKAKFLLDFSKDNYKLLENIQERYSELYNNDIRVVYLIEIKDNIDEVMSFLENSECEHEHFLVYDKEDEIEFFLKDLWNVIISLTG